jgi:hypothetical protein
MEAHFTRSDSWTAVTDNFRAPELSELEFVECAVRDGCILVLVTWSLQRPPSTAPGQWCRSITVTPSLAWKFALLWCVYLRGSPNDRPQLDRLMQQWAELGKDTDAKFALTALLGLGTQSQFPIEFRVFVRLLRVFVLLSIPVNAGGPPTEVLMKEARAGLGTIRNIEGVLSWMEHRHPLSTVAEFVQMVATVLAPSTLYLHVACVL